MTEKIIMRPKLPDNWVASQPWQDAYTSSYEIPETPEPMTPTDQPRRERTDEIEIPEALLGIAAFIGGPVLILLSLSMIIWNSPLVVSMR